MKFNSIILSLFFIFLPKHFCFSSFLQTKLSNPTQSQNGGGDQMYDRIQQAAEHIFLPFPHKMAFFEHQNPYVIYPTIQDELKDKKKGNEKIDKEHDIYHKALDSELQKSMKALSSKIKYSNVNKINKEDDTFEFKLNPHIGTESENDTQISKVLEQSEALSKENADSKTGKLMAYAGKEYNKALKQVEDNGKLTVGEQLSAYDIGKLNLNLSEDFLNQNVMDRDTSKLDTSEQVTTTTSEDEEKTDTLANLQDLIEKRAPQNEEMKPAEKQAVSYTGLQSMFPGNKNSNSKDLKKKTVYNGWIKNNEIPYFDKLYMDGYYDDIMQK